MAQKKSENQQIDELVNKAEAVLDDHFYHEQHENQDKDHYHGIHHFDEYGNHDDVTSADFELKSVFRLTKKNLIFKIVLTGVFLALTAAVSGLDILAEYIHIPVNGDQVWIETRFLDITVVMISIAVLGPLFSSVIGFIAPIMHNAIHGGEHGWIQPPIQSVEYVIIVWLVFIIFNLIFRNSPIHRDENIKVANFKRWTPIPIMIVLFATIVTLGFILALFIQAKISAIDPNSGWLPNHDHTHDHKHAQILSSTSQFILGHAGHDHDDENKLNYDKLNLYTSLAVFGWNCLRYTISMSLFAVIEWRMRPINHRYR
ncbi:ECF transporter S component [Mycoplasma sp. HU2014]|uniref:ECF transporter S component n=1 Tax=Mycoplasma sp. HU2014 TaxID=1664275 RepID=UPI00067CAC72|nr:ECF transporter S component [Mycoplasma sp. HU2014]KNG79097.1 membrane protein [Mycoplasma sp. HU2014]